MTKMQREAKRKARRIVYDLIESFFVASILDLETDEGKEIDKVLERIQQRFDDRGKK